MRFTAMEYSEELVHVSGLSVVLVCVCVCLTLPCHTTRMINLAEMLGGHTKLALRRPVKRLALLLLAKLKVQGAVEGGGVETRGFADLDLSVLFGPFSRIFPILGGFSRLVLFLFLGLLEAPARNIPEKDLSQKRGEAPRCTFSQRAPPHGYGIEFLAKCHHMVEELGFVKLLAKVRPCSHVFPNIWFHLGFCIQFLQNGASMGLFSHDKLDLRFKGKRP